MKTPRTKQRQANHITGDRGINLVRSKLPDYWVARDINPDYGLDLHVEVFEEDPHDAASSNTLGEHFYVQVKTFEHLKTERVTVRHRSNVTKRTPDLQQGDPVEIDVVKFSLDTATLLTVQTMGAAVPVLLFLVDLSTKTVFYVCLNDYIEKSVLPYKPSYEEQGSVTIVVPAWNVLDADDFSFAYLWFLARRGKFYAAFNTFAYQFHELQRALDSHPPIPDEHDIGKVYLDPEFRAMALAFLRTSLRLAIWVPSGPGYWAPLEDVKNDLESCLNGFPPDTALYCVAASHFETYLHEAFRRADNLGRMYEEIVREWRLPTAMASVLDYRPENKHNPPPLSEEKQKNYTLNMHRTVALLPVMAGNVLAEDG